MDERRALRFVLLLLALASAPAVYHLVAHYVAAMPDEE